jgi:hypothetical protein
MIGSSEEFGVLLISEKGTLTTFCILSLIRFSDVFGLASSAYFLHCTAGNATTRYLGIECVYIYIGGFQ